MIMRTLFLLSMLFSVSLTFGQDIEVITIPELIYRNDFETDTGFELNTEDIDGQVGTQNIWVINDVYKGGSGVFTCSEMEVTFDVPAAKQQPAEITNNPTSRYLHITPQIAMKEGGTLPAASFVVYDGICMQGNESSFAKMTADFSTYNMERIEIDMWWMCGGSEDYYGEVYFSTDQGITWEPLICPRTGTTSWYGISTWMPAQLRDEKLSNQETVRLGFRFITGTTPDGTMDPGFAIDDITVTGYEMDEEIVEEPIEEDPAENTLYFDESIGDEITVYPNPTKGELFLQVPAAFDKVNVILRNVEGKIMHQQLYDGAGNVELFIEGERGIYLVEVQAGNRSQVYKVIKQ